jgi:glycerol kinase
MSVNKDIIIALDEGTTNAKAVALDGSGTIVAIFARAGDPDPREGWVEQSAVAACSVAGGHLSCHRAVGAERVAALAISNQRETVVGWYRETGSPSPRP